MRLNIIRIQVNCQNNCVEDAVNTRAATFEELENSVTFSTDFTNTFAEYINNKRKV